MTKYAQRPTMQQQKKAIFQWVVGTTSRIGMLAVIGVLAVAYVIQTSSVSVKGYDISDLQKQVNLLKQEEQRLQVEIAGYRSIESIGVRLATMNMVPAQDTEYVSHMGTAIARR